MTRANPLTAGLGKAGTALVKSIVADMADALGEPDSREFELLRLAGELKDRMTDLEASIAEDGLRRETKAGTIQLHPGAAELRNHAVALAKVLSSIALVDATGAPVKSARHVRAARVRWANARVGH